MVILINFKKISNLIGLFILLGQGSWISYFFPDPGYSILNPDPHYIVTLLFDNTLNSQITGFCEVVQKPFIISVIENGIDEKAYEH